MDILASPFGQHALDRFPPNADDTLRAWDAADEYLINYIAEQQLLDRSKKILVINDQFGALCVALSQAEQETALTSWSDSKLGQLALEHNSENNPGTNPISFLASTEALKGSFDLVLIKVPKVLGLLEHQLAGLKSAINDETVIIGAGMSKHIHTSTLKLFEAQLGSTRTSLAVKKARLIFAENDGSLQASSRYPIVYKEPTLDVVLSNHANVFSKEKLDIGARFFIEHFKQLPMSEIVIDLGCGNGILGVMAKRRMPDAECHFVDESYMALDSARDNVEQNIGEAHRCHFHSSDSLSQYQGPKADLILCNPPFHQQHVVGDQIARNMFKQSAANLSETGELWVVANRHLGYHHKLKRWFKQCRTVAGNKKFVILQASNSPNKVM